MELHPSISSVSCNDWRNMTVPDICDYGVDGTGKLRRVESGPNWWKLCNCKSIGEKHIRFLIVYCAIQHACMDEGKLSGVKWVWKWG